MILVKIGVNPEAKKDFKFPKKKKANSAGDIFKKTKSIEHDLGGRRKKPIDVLNSERMGKMVSAPPVFRVPPKSIQAIKSDKPGTDDKMAMHLANDLEAVEDFE
jgi:hypothetical protein